MKVEHSDLVKEIFGLRINNENEPLKQFLIRNPFIGINGKNGLIVFVFVDKETFNDAMSNHCEKDIKHQG